ncbi:MAG: amidohydrolase [Terricaulis sp.]|nr:amidohydrolase [Terricaulis sp.]
MSQIEIIDAQIHEPPLPQPPEGLDPAVRSLIGVELAREAMDSAGVDAALLVASPTYIDACVARYPSRFAGVHTLDPSAEDLPSRIAGLRDKPGHLAARALIADWRDAALRRDFKEGAFDAIFEACARHDTPLFVSTHGWAEAMADIAARYPDLTLIIDHFGVSQSPVSPPRAEPWDRLPGLLALARFPNVHVKLCGAPLLSRRNYPFEDVWPYLMQVIEAFEPRRLMWASDYTRLRMAPGRRLGVLYSESRDFLFHTEKLSRADKEAIFGGTARRVLRWPARMQAGA